MRTPHSLPDLCRVGFLLLRPDACPDDFFLSPAIIVTSIAWSAFYCEKFFAPSASRRRRATKRLYIFASLHKRKRFVNEYLQVYCQITYECHVKNLHCSVVRDGCRESNMHVLYTRARPRWGTECNNLWTVALFDRRQNVEIICKKKKNHSIRPSTRGPYIIRVTSRDII